MARNAVFGATSFALLAGLVFLAPRIAFADPEPEVSDSAPDAVEPPGLYDRMLGVEIIGGFNTSYGLIGGSLRLAPIDYLVIDAGAGVSLDGVRVSGGVSGVFPQDHFALVFRLGAAGGPLSWESGAQVNTRRYWNFTAFVDASLGLEYRWDEGITGRFSVGIEGNVIGTADTCTVAGAACDPSLGSHPTRLYLSLAVGYMFDLNR